MLRVLAVIGRILGYVLIAGTLVAITAADVYVLVHYGLLAWLFVLPIALGLAWFCVAMTAMLVSLMVAGLVRFIRWLVRHARRSVLDANEAVAKRDESDEPSPGAKLDALLHEMVESSSPQRFREALRAITDMGPHALPLLNERLHPNDHLCVPACIAVEGFGDVALRFFLSVVQDERKTSRVRVGAVQGLQRFARSGNADAFRELRRLEQDGQESDVQKWARVSLDHISRNALGPVESNSPGSED